MQPSINSLQKPPPIQGEWSSFSGKAACTSKKCLLLQWYKSTSSRRRFLRQWKQFHCDKRIQHVNVFQRFDALFRYRRTWLPTLMLTANGPNLLILDTYATCTSSELTDVYTILLSHIYIDNINILYNIDIYHVISLLFWCAFDC